MDALDCPRHPGTETRLRCSSCETPICPDCAVEATVGYRCPVCAGVPDRAAAPTGRPSGRTSGRTPGRVTGARTGGSDQPRGGQGTPPIVVARAFAVGIAAAALGGALLGPVLRQGTLSLLSSGVLGWAVARAVLWAAEETATPFTRALAVAFAGAMAAVGTVAAGTDATGAGLSILAVPAALYGGWVVVRRR